MESLSSTHDLLLHARPATPSAFLTVALQAGGCMQKRLEAVRRNLESIAHIKDKHNRAVCRRVSARALEVLAGYAARKITAYPHGVLAYFGETREGAFIERVFDSFDVAENLYSLDNAFDLRPLQRQLEARDDEYLFVYMNGADFVVYCTNSRFELKSTPCRRGFSVQKHQRKGGSSSNRIARLAEETRDNTLKVCCDEVRRVFCERTRTVFVAGVEPWPRRLIEALRPLPVFADSLVQEDPGFHAIVANHRAAIADSAVKATNAEVDAFVQEYRRDAARFATGPEAVRQMQQCNVEQVFYFPDQVQLVNAHAIRRKYAIDKVTGTTQFVAALGGALAKLYVSEQV